MNLDTSTRTDVLLVGYEHQENLGLRSILAFLRARGHRAELVPFVPGEHARVQAAIDAHHPRLVGFSLIFQYTLDEFGALLRALRDGGTSAHFTAGGHFPSLRPEQTLELLPELDTVVRFEGELTLLELLDHVDAPWLWPSIRGLAFRSGGAVTVNAPRPLIADLDTLPPVARDHQQEVSDGVRMASLLASRGCLFDCSFCSIRNFYRGAPGAPRRVRSPDAVVAEMCSLHSGQGVRYFSFQDDDFAASTPAQRRWLSAFLDRLDETGLAKDVRWKISCRVTDLEAETLRAMQGRGLFAVYLGVESGSAEGLRALNKRATVEENLAAVELMKRHGVALSMGFMLFDPSSTIGALRDNIAFLRRAGADGYFPVNFGKMLPYAGTPVEAQLRGAGRLTGTAARPDYGYLDPRIGLYEVLVQHLFSRRNFDPGGNVALLQKVDFDHRLGRAFAPASAEDATGAALRAIIARSNGQAVETLSALLDALLEHGGERLVEEKDVLVDLAEREWLAEMTAEVDLARLLAAKGPA